MRQARQIQESAVFVGQEWSGLRYAPIVPGSLTMETIPAGGVFEENKDFIVDYEIGRIRRTADSRLPDWRENVFFGQDHFDHTVVETYGNQAFTVFLTYTYCTEEPEPARTHLLQAKCPKFWAKLTAGEPVLYAVYGDSISTGADVTLPQNTYYARFVRALETEVPGARITCVNEAIGGEESRRGLERIGSALYPQNPDLVTIAYGMNDQSLNFLGNHNVEADEFYENIRGMVRGLKEHTDADICLITPCLPNPKWYLASGDTEIYARCIRRVARGEDLLLADVTRLWQEELAGGKTPESLLHNNINHPNDYGHSLYARALCGNL